MKGAEWEAGSRDPREEVALNMDAGAFASPASTHAGFQPLVIGSGV